MNHLIALFHATELATVGRIAAGLDEPPHLLVFDPTLIDRAAAERLGPVHCVRWDDGPSYQQRNDAARAETLAIERTLAAVVRRFLPDTPIQGWQQLSLYYLQMALQWFRPMFEARADALATLLDGGTCHVPVCENAQSFYFPSFVPGLALVQQLVRSGLKFQAYSHRRADAPTDLVPGLSAGSLPAQGPWLLAHLPTCMYDAPHFSRELRASGKPLVRFKAKYWDVPLEGDITIAPALAGPLAEALPAETRERIDAAAQALAAPLDAWLSRWINAPSYRQRQVDQLVQIYRAQLVADRLLALHGDANPPSHVLLSDHDCDFHGPLVAYAQRHQRPVLVLPHSKTSPDLDFMHYRHAQSLHHAVQGEAVHDANGQRLLQAAIELPGTLTFDVRPDAQLRTVGLLLNGAALGGVPTVDYTAYARGLAQIHQWCAAQGLTLLIRSRPGQSMVRLLVEEAGLPLDVLAEGLQGTMVEFAQRCDLCLMYDAPTSGALELLSRGIPVLNPVVTTLTHREAATVDAQIVPRADVADTLRHVGQLAADPLSYQRLRRWQFSAYTQRLAGAEALRRFV